ncbi:peroxiredoxin [Rhodobacteraceae bacterium RKSG542]|uniref:peroxiredoxin n=1 Tax=Pseudovibrio flavus TaxID=2529854 RepID=UPI0012BC545E|nr:peroxiredoxin [Pseudovibrio flavus]MTI18653.1 peroxiredoxin [Pseudovibrio flavus]
MTIKVGETLPSATLFVLGSSGPEAVSSSDLFAGKKVVLFAVPGAFTPTCSASHVPSYRDHADEILAKGVDMIAVVSVNDPFVMHAWEESSDTKGKIKFLSDANGELTKAVGLDIDISAVGLGVRSKRYSMLLDNGTVKVLNVEENPSVMEVSGADEILKAL